MRSLIAGIIVSLNCVSFSQTTETVQTVPHLNLVTSGVYIIQPEFFQQPQNRPLRPSVVIKASTHTLINEYRWADGYTTTSYVPIVILNFDSAQGTSDTLLATRQSQDMISAGISKEQIIFYENRRLQNQAFDAGISGLERMASHVVDVWLKQVR